MKQTATILFIILMFLHTEIMAQTKSVQKPVQKQRSLRDFPELLFTNIPGAPKLSAPILITGKEKPVLSEGHGLAAPAFYDWDGDGIKDLLIGEFGSGVENGRYIGNFIRVFKNVGTEINPEFTGRFDYARPPFEFKNLTNGTPYSVDQFCCIGFTPQFVDLNNDGYNDMITGSYYGEVYWFAGNELGFKPGVELTQELPDVGGPRSKMNRKKPNQFYWLYSSASFGDFTNDGKPDMIVGGRALRISKNVGTDAEPIFAQREFLLDIHGKPLQVYELNKDELKYYDDMKFLGYEPPVSGDLDLSPFVVDWDNDGVLDLLVTSSYYHKGLEAVTFFQGVKLNGEHRFRNGISLFTPKQAVKALPGSGPRISVVDWNNDGIKDLLLGVNTVTVHGVINNKLSWNWENDINLPPAGKDPANLTDIDDEALKGYKKTAKLPEGISIEDYMTIRHQGYVYVMLGKN